MRTPGKSVGRRLLLLMCCQTTIAALLVLMALRELSGFAADYRHMYEFQLHGIAAIAGAMEGAASLQNGARSAELEAFHRRYSDHWETATALTPHAIRFRRHLLEAGSSDLPQIEAETVAELGRALQEGKADQVRADLAALHSVNVRYADFEAQYVLDRIRSGTIWLAGIGVAGITLTFLLGFHVRRAIAPRIQVLVGQVRRFQASGAYERIADGGKDDIGVLANALDAGFASIASRERDRERFLAIAAHELKTPVTSIQGYASLLVDHSEQMSNIFRALEIINRQSYRLSRLIEALFLATEVRSGNLRFRPKPLDLSALVRRVLQEMEPFLSMKTFSAQVTENISILGDEALLEHALWCLFTCASALSPANTPIEVALSANKQCASLSVDIKGSGFSVPEVEELFLPFRSVEFENGSGVRSAVGLYLCREIVRLHNGRLSVHQASEVRPEFLVELPI